MLPSQYGSTAGRRVMYRRRRRRLSRPMMLVLVAGGVAAAVWGVQRTGLLDPSAGGSSGERAVRPPVLASAEAQPQRESEPRARATQPERRERAARPTPPPTGQDLASGESALSRAIERTRGEREAAPAPVEISQRPAPERPAVGAAAEAVQDRAAGAGEEASPTAGNGRGERAPFAAPGLDEATSRAIAAAEAALSRNDPLRARALLNSALHAGEDPRALRELRDRLSELNERLVFSPVVTPGDPMSVAYEVQPGDALSRIVRKQGLGIDWRVVQDINGLSAPERISVGQTLKLLRGPFHVIVTKREYRVDLYWGEGEDHNGWTYIRSFAAGLGEHDSTPTGRFRLRQNGKLANPAWTNPRTGERFAADDPENPIGEYWVGIEGIGEAARHTGYGLHGTIEPESIGSQQSMGCVRLLDDDIRLVYSLLSENDSFVIIRP